MIVPQGEGAPPPQAPPPVNDAAAKPQNVQRQSPTEQRQDRQERARLAEQDLQYVRRSYLRAADPIVVRYRRLLRQVA